MSKKSEKKLTFDIRQRLAADAARELAESQVAEMRAELDAMKAAAAKPPPPAAAVVPATPAAPTRAEVRENVMKLARAARNPLEQAQIILSAGFSLLPDDAQDHEFALRGRTPPEAA